MMIRSKIFNRILKTKKRKTAKAAVCILSVLLCFSMTSAQVALYAAADTSLGTSYDREHYRSELTEAGFPPDYADKLAEIKLAHPAWSFIPLEISELEPEYSFDYIINRETEDPSANLVYPSDEFSGFFDKESGAVYDSGWYSASDDAVRYFVDPRNFLNERDIFQFEDLSYYDRDYSSGVDGVLDGTFMQQLMLENGELLSDYILKVGAELSVSPVHIAARMRQEQGVENSSGMISGECGDLLLYFYENGTQYTQDGKLVLTPASGHTRDELLSYNGYYNFFNMGATGNGLFSIYLNAMKRAKQGTADLADHFSGNASWDKMYKSVYGGVYSLKSTYIDDYQNNLYLQKFNVDPRSSRNFWGQYMQNVGAALSEGRSAYLSYKEAGILESEFVFLIPVFSDMPQDPCPDPSGGKSYYSSSDDIYTYITHTDYPLSLTSENSETRAKTEIKLGESLRVQGWSVHSYGTEYYEISVDGGAFERINSYPRADVREKYAQQYPLSFDVNAYLCYIDTAQLGVGEHTVTVRAKTTAGSYCQLSYLDLTVVGVKGDVNGDSQLNSADLSLVLRYLSGYNVTITGDADINGDGRINNRDLLELAAMLKTK